MNQTSVRVAISQLGLASKLLLSVAALHLLFFVPRTLIDPKLIFNLLWLASAALCIAGFVIANAHLGFTDEASDFTQPKLIIGRRTERKARLSIALFFYGAFLVPLLNLIIALWTYFRIRAAVRGFERTAREAREAEARRRSKFGPSVPSTFAQESRLDR